MFGVALGALMGVITDEFNDRLIPQLMTMNGAPRDAWPRLTHGDVEKRDLAALAEYVTNLMGSGALVAGEEVDRFVREEAGLPPAE